MKTTPTSLFTFHLLGTTEDQWFILRAPTWPTSRRKAKDAWAFKQEVAQWLLTEVGGLNHHMGNGNAAGYPELKSASRTGSTLCLLLRNASDVLRLANKFPVKGLDKLEALLPPETEAQQAA